MIVRFAIVLVVLCQSLFAGAQIDLVSIERQRILVAADSFLLEQPVTITSFRSPRSAGGIHDFSSEGDYWWPDPTNPEGPYVQRDGMTNPENFVEHRITMVRFSIHVGTLTSAYRISKDKKYAAHAAKHLVAWFVADATRMNPNLLYAQAIKGRVTGRGIGIIDTIHLIEIAKAVPIIESAGVLTAQEGQAIRKWFAEYMRWMMTHQYGIDEREAKNNHGTCWVMQVAAFAQLVGDSAAMRYCRTRYKEVLLPNQMAADGSFPLELKRTKPYSYSIFNLDAFATICQLLSNLSDDLWRFTLPDGRSMRKGIEFLYPFLKDKSRWMFSKDVMHWEEWPVRQPSLLFAGLAFNRTDYIELWKALNPSPTNQEVIRNLPIRHPLLWVE